MRSPRRTDLASTSRAASQYLRNTQCRHCGMLSRYLHAPAPHDAPTTAHGTHGPSIARHRRARHARMCVPFHPQRGKTARCHAALHVAGLLPECRNRKQGMPSLRFAAVQGQHPDRCRLAQPEQGFSAELQPCSPADTCQGFSAELRPEKVKPCSAQLLPQSPTHGTMLAACSMLTFV